MNLRELGFWSIDRLLGGHVTSQYKDIKMITENYTDYRPLVQKRLEEFLTYASTHVDFYRPYKDKSLEEYPLLTKLNIKKDYDSHLSDEFNKKSLIEEKTSGSYGTPLGFLMTKSKKSRQRAEVIYYGEWAQYYIGTNHIYIRANDNKNNLKLLIQNETFIKTDVYSEDWLEKQRKVFKDSKAEVIIGFPTAIAEIASYCLKNGDNPKDFKIKGVITSGEALYDNHRQIIERVFDCICISRYSTEELGVLAVECPKCKKHHINVASYHIEILKEDSDEHVAPGGIGRVIVTDMYSHAMPLIRYDTGDLAYYSDQSCNCGLPTPILGSVEGRSLEMIIKPNGEKLAPFFVNPIMSYAKGITQFQFVQLNQNEYVLKIVGEILNSEKLHLNQRFLEELGSDANFRIELVKEIPTLRSGKRAYVVNQYTK